MFYQTFSSFLNLKVLYSQVTYFYNKINESKPSIWICSIILQEKMQQQMHCEISPKFFHSKTTLAFLSLKQVSHCNDQKIEFQKFDCNCCKIFVWIEFFLHFNFISKQNRSKFNRNGQQIKAPKLFLNYKNASLLRTQTFCFLCDVACQLFHILSTKQWSDFDISS